MPSKRRRRTKKRKKIWTKPPDLTPWAWGAVGIVVLSGLAFSPTTSLRTVRVVGAAPYDHDRLQDLAKTLKGGPYLRIDTDRVQSLAMQDQTVKSAQFQGNLFGTGVLRMTYRRPVAVIAGTTDLYLSAEGSIFRSPAGHSLRIEVEPPYAPGDRNLSVFGSWRSGLAAKMCENIRERLPDRRWRLVVTHTGFVSLVPESGATVEFGSFDGADTKVAKLAELIRDDPELLERVRSVQLSSPTTPTIVPR